MKTTPSAPIESLLQAISEHLLHAAKRQGLQKQQLAELAGVNRNTITAALKGADMRLSTLIRLTRVLKDTDWILPLLTDPEESPLQQVKPISKVGRMPPVSRPAARPLGLQKGRAE